MALTFGSGEQVDRLRRGLDIKGRVVLAVDEIVVPVVNVGDFTGPPIRKTGIRWWTNIDVPAVAAERGQCRIFHFMPNDQLLDTLILRAAGAALLFRIGSGQVGTAAGATTAQTTELVDLPIAGGFGGGAIARGVGMFSEADSSVGSTLTNRFIELAGANAVDRVFHGDIVLPATNDPEGGVGNPSTITIESNSLNVAFSVTASGLYFDTLPLNVRT